MAQIITVNLNMDKLDASKAYIGKSGTYQSLVLLPLKQADKFGNTHTVVMSQSKEEREQNIPAIYVGSAKIVGK
jgi:hypothetical protein